MLTITLPLPNKRLRPNHKAGTRGAMLAKARETRKYRYLAKLLCMEQLGANRPRHEGAVVLYTFWFASKRYVLDADNAIGSMKAALDGLVDAGLLADDNKVRLLDPLRLVDSTRPRVDVQVESWTGVY